MLRFFVRDQRGAAAIEFGLIAPIMTAVLITTATMGGLVMAYNKMSQGVSGGAQYAMTVGAGDTAAIKDVVLKAWDDKPANGAVTVQQVCLCGTTVSACNVNCVDTGDYPEKVTTINASMSYADFAGGSHAISTQQKVRTW
jgi:Flp pilus assembly protein TadG